MAKPNAKVTAVVLALTLGLVATFEGSPPRSYMDRMPANPTPTACMGHTGADVKVGVAYTAAQCEQWARDDIDAANVIVHRCIAAPMTKYQEAALTDAAYNLGSAVVCGSTLQRYANAGQWSAACQQLTRWVYAGGEELPGLVRRRHTPEPIPAPDPVALAALARSERDALMRACDWTQGQDSPLSADQRAAWATYRQALRNVPEQEGFPGSISWPTAPDAVTS